MRRSSIFAISIMILLVGLTVAPVAGAQGGADARRRTIAITYFRDPVKVQMAGTTLRPNAKGEASVERWRKRNTSEIDITIENMIPAYNFGGDYNTYVLWAVTPAGQIDNLGEFRLSGGSARLKASTPHQTFAMVITAEPHYLVRLPSRMVVLENMTPVTNKVQVQATEVYFTGDSGKFYTDSTVPEVAERDYNKTPMELLQARRAVQIARLADGSRFAPNDFNSASKFLQDAEELHRQGASVHEVGRVSREAITMAVRTRDISEERAVAADRRAEIARRDDEVRRANENASGLESKLSDFEVKLRASELSRTNAEEQLNRALREAADARAESRRLREENNQLRYQLDQQGRELSDTRSKLDTMQTQVDATKNRVEEMERAEQTREQAETRRKEIADLQATLAKVGTVRQSAEGFILTLPDSFFVPNQTSLGLPAKAKMDLLGKTMAQYRSFTFTIEGHTDVRPNAETFALGRAQSVAAYIAAYGVPQENYTVESKGSSVPVSAAKTVRARAMNRRVEIIITPSQ